MSRRNGIRRLGFVLTAGLMLLVGVALGLRDPGRITLSTKPRRIDWLSTVKQVFDGEFSLAREEFEIEPDRFLIYTDRNPGTFGTGNPRRPPTEGYLVRLGDREELTERLGEGFERQFVHRLGGIACGDVQLWNPSGPPPAPAVVIRPRQLYFVHRKYGPRSTKKDQEEFGVVEVLHHDIADRVLTLRRYAVR